MYLQNIIYALRIFFQNKSLELPKFMVLSRKHVMLVWERLLFLRIYNNMSQRIEIELREIEIRIIADKKKIKW